MARGRIPREFVEQLRERLRLVDVINTYVPLKKAGKEYQACCPFHEEKSPSFTVSEEKGFYHCFGCKAHGDAFDFVREHLGLEFVEAVEVLAQHAGMEVPYEQVNRSEVGAIETGHLDRALTKAVGVYQAVLTRSGAPATRIWREGGRGALSDEYALGYAAPGPDKNPIAAIVAGNETLSAAMTALGLVKSEGGTLSDVVRDALVFPVRRPNRKLEGVYVATRPRERAVWYGLSDEQGILGMYERVQRNSLSRDELDHPLIVTDDPFALLALRERGVTRVICLPETGSSIGPHPFRRIFGTREPVVLAIDENRFIDPRQSSLLRSVPAAFRDGDLVTVISTQQLLSYSTTADIAAAAANATSYGDIMLLRLREGARSAGPTAHEVFESNAKAWFADLQDSFYRTFLMGDIEDIANDLRRAPPSPAIDLDRIAPVELQLALMASEFPEAFEELTLEGSDPVRSLARKLVCAERLDFDERVLLARIVKCTHLPDLADATARRVWAEQQAGAKTGAGSSGNQLTQRTTTPARPLRL